MKVSHFLHMPEDDVGAEAELHIEKFRHGIFLLTPHWSSRELLCSVPGELQGYGEVVPVVCLLLSLSLS